MLQTLSSIADGTISHYMFTLVAEEGKDFSMRGPNFKLLQIVKQLFNHRSWPHVFSVLAEK